MPATRVPPPPLTTPLTDGRFVSNAWRLFFTAIYNAVYGGGFDRIDAARAAALAAAPKVTQVVASGGLHQGGALGGNVGIALYVTRDIVANLPTTGNAPGDLAYATDGCKAGETSGSGTGVPVWWTPGSPTGAWHAFDSGAVVTA